MNASDEDMERLLLRYFINDDWAARGSQPLDSIFEQIGRPSGWRNSFFDQLSTPIEKGALSAILERMAADGLLRVTDTGNGRGPHFEAAYDVKQHPRYEHLYPSSPPKQDLQKAIDSTDWTGLASNASQSHIVEIKQSVVGLQQAIMQSDASIDVKMDACKRVEAVIFLLEAPNVPWKQVVELLNHPSVTAFLTALNIIQFILGLAS